MGVLAGQIRVEQSEVDLVWSYDPGVVCPEDLAHAGWFPKSLASQVSKDADVVRVRALNADEYTSIRDVDGSAQKRLECARWGVVAVNGERDKSKINSYLEALVLGLPSSVDLLGNAIEAMTVGIGAEAQARNVHAIVLAHMAGEAPPTPSKSARSRRLRTR